MVFVLVLIESFRIVWFKLLDEIEYEQKDRCRSKPLKLAIMYEVAQFFDFFQT